MNISNECEHEYEYIWIPNECEHKYEYITILKQKSVSNPTVNVKMKFHSYF